MKTNNQATINERIKNIINELILTGKVKNKTDFAQKLGTKLNTITEILGNRQSPTLETMQKICTVFGINTDWLLSGTGEMLKSQMINVNAGGVGHVGNRNTGDINLSQCQQEVETLKTQLKDKEERLKDKEEIIALLREKLKQQTKK
jgi:transcriptional regulator with XRE-family HTH domain